MFINTYFIYNIILRGSMETKDRKSVGERLKNCIQTAYNIINVGRETNDELEKQGEKLEKINGKTVIIDKNVTNAHRSLDNMSSFVRSLFGSVKYDVEKDRSWLVKSAGKLPQGEPLPSDLKETDESGEEEFDKQLDQLYDLTLQMKQMSLEMNQSLDKHNEIIEEIDTRVDKSNYDIRTANKKIKKLME